MRLRVNIEANISHLEKTRKELANSTESRKKLAQSLYIEVEDLISKSLPYPTTVCTSQSCIEVVNYQNNTKINYKMRCHENCGLDMVDTNKVGKSNYLFYILTLSLPKALSGRIRSAHSISDIRLIFY